MVPMVLYCTVGRQHQTVLSKNGTRSVATSVSRLQFRIRTGESSFLPLEQRQTGLCGTDGKQHQTARLKNGTRLAVISCKHSPLKIKMDESRYSPMAPMVQYGTFGRQHQMVHSRNGIGWVYLMYKNG